MKILRLNPNERLNPEEVKIHFFIKFYDFNNFICIRF